VYSCGFRIRKTEAYECSIVFPLRPRVENLNRQREGNKWQLKFLINVNACRLRLRRVCDSCNKLIVWKMAASESPWHLWVLCAPPWAIFLWFKGVTSLQMKPIYGGICMREIRNVWVSGLMVGWMNLANYLTDSNLNMHNCIRLVKYGKKWQGNY